MWSVNTWWHSCFFRSALEGLVNIQYVIKYFNTDSYNTGTVHGDDSALFLKNLIKAFVLQVDKLADTLMPPGIRSLRTMLHATAVEVLLYVTPLHCQEVLDSIVQSLNLQYRRFMKRNPEFKVRLCDNSKIASLLLCGAILNAVHWNNHVIWGLTVCTCNLACCISLNDGFTMANSSKSYDATSTF